MWTAQGLFLLCFHLWGGASSLAQSCFWVCRSVRWSSGSRTVTVQGKHRSLVQGKYRVPWWVGEKINLFFLFFLLSSYWQSVLQDIPAYQQDLEKKRGSQWWDDRLGTNKGSWTCSTLWGTGRVRIRESENVQGWKGP